MRLWLLNPRIHQLQTLFNQHTEATASFWGMLMSLFHHCWKFPPRCFKLSWSLSAMNLTCVLVQDSRVRREHREEIENETLKFWKSAVKSPFCATFTWLHTFTVVNTTHTSCCNYVDSRQMYVVISLSADIQLLIKCFQLCKIPSGSKMLNVEY